ncbi:MAG: hypothetical protein AB7I79_04050 [Rhizobiaceae bacterium]
MTPWEQLASARVPGGTDELRLKRRGDEYSIMLGANELMNSRVSGSEQALARLACAASGPGPHVLIGGLGMGFTLRAALAALDPDARLVVAELVPEVVAWGRGPMSALLAGSLDDPRVEVRVGDVGEIIRSSHETFDTIMLDVDNGPEGLTRPENDRLYSRHGLAGARKALKHGGVLAVWSSAPDQRFSTRLRDAGFDVEVKMVRANAGRRGARHTVWLARPLAIRRPRRR